jgi:hypothetical protein
VLILLVETVSVDLNLRLVETIKVLRQTLEETLAKMVTKEVNAVNEIISCLMSALACWFQAHWAIIFPMLAFDVGGWLVLGHVGIQSARGEARRVAQRP